MKQCPQCGREYDCSMMFCLDDGSELLYGPAAADEPATAILSARPVGESVTRPQIRATDDDHTRSGAESRKNSGGSVSQPSRSSNRAVKPLMAVAAAAVVLIGSYFAYLYLKPLEGKQIETI